MQSQRDHQWLICLLLNYAKNKIKKKAKDFSRIPILQRTQGKQYELNNWTLRFPHSHIQLDGREHPFRDKSRKDQELPTSLTRSPRGDMAQGSYLSISTKARVIFRLTAVFPFALNNLETVGSGVEINST